MLGSRKIAFNVPVNWLFGIVAIGLALILAYVLGNPAWHADLTFGAAVIGGSAGLISAANNLDLRISQRDQSVALADQARVAGSMSFIHAWNSPQFFHCKKNGRAIIEKFKEAPTFEEQIKYLDSDPTLYANLVDVLNVFEAMNIAIDNKVIDEKVAKLFFCSVVIQYWHTTETFIRKRRSERANSRIFCEFESLFGKWK